MYIYRKEDLSVYYWILDMFNDVPFLTVVDSFPDQILAVPTVSIDAGKLDEEPFELGNREKIRIRRWYIDIFARNKSQRDDMGYRLMYNSTNGISINNYDEGFPPAVTPSVIGHMAISANSYEPVPVILDLNEKLYYRGQVILVTQNDTV